MDKGSVLEEITVYTYGKLLAPRSFVKKRNQASGKRSHDVNITSGLGCFNRPALITKLHRLLEVHRAERRYNAINGIICNRAIHKALLKAIRLCYEYKICESKLFPVGDLFLELFLCMGNSCSIFSIFLSVQMSTMSHADSEILYPSNRSGEMTSAFEYYLQHISSVKHSDKDLMNLCISHESGLTPLSAGIQKRDPELVLQLLRYGADPFYTIEDSDPDMYVQNPTEQLIDDLNGLFLFKNTGFSEETCSKLRAEEIKVWQCLKYFRRAVVEIPITSTNHIVTTYADDVYEEHEKLNVKKSYGVRRGIAENLNFDFFKPTVSLKHLCRCAIRQRLNENRSKKWSIPKSISLLPLPLLLRQYLDLKSD
ncbi:hypothetical protein ACF0H5_006329 [Mactra antiquata]